MMYCQLGPTRGNKTKGMFHVWLNRCNCVSCSLVFPPVLSASPSPLWDANVKGENHSSVEWQKNKIIADSCCLSPASVLIISQKIEDEILSLN